MAVNKFQTGGVDSNWGTTGNWSQGTVPTASDGHVTTFDGTSPACTVNTSSRVANTLDFTGYTGTITMSQQITVSGSVTLALGMTISGSGALLVDATATLTSNGKTWPNALNLGVVSGSQVFTLADNWTVQGLLTLGSTSTTKTYNGFQITASAGLTHSGSSGIVTGTTVIVMNGTGTITGATTTGSFRLSLTINTSGTITFAAAAFNFNTATLTYTAGTVVTTGSTLNILTGATTLAVAGITWQAVKITGTITVTLSENLSVAGLLTIGSAALVATINGNTITCTGGLRYDSTANSAGTTAFSITATQTLDNTSTGTLTNAITINASGGTVSITSGFRCDIGKLTYTAGTVVPSGGTQWASVGGAATPYVIGC